MAPYPASEEGEVLALLKALSLSVKNLETLVAQQLQGGGEGQKEVTKTLPDTVNAIKKRLQIEVLRSSLWTGSKEYKEMSVTDKKEIEYLTTTEQTGSRTVQTALNYRCTKVPASIQELEKEGYTVKILNNKVLLEKVAEMI